MASRKKHNLIHEWRDNKDHVRWIFAQGKRFGKYSIGFLSISLVGMIVSLGSSVAGKYVVDAATGFETEAFWKYIVIMLVTTLASIGVSLFSALFGSYVSEKFAFSIRAEMFDRVQRSSWYEVSRFHSADILSRLTSDINTLSSSIITIAPSVIVSALELIIVAGILIYYDPIMAIIGFIIGPLGLAAGAAFRRKFIEYQKKLRESESEYYSFFQESLANLSVTKVFQLEDANNEYFRNVREKRMGIVMKNSHISAVMGILVKIIYNIGYVIAFSWCAYRLSQEGSGYTYGTMTLFLSLVSILQGTIKTIGGVIPQMFSTIVSAKRIRAITDIPEEDYSGSKKSHTKVGLVMKDISFAYEDEKVLDNVSVSINPGERIGIVGSSGAGKTTFVRLLLSLISADSGKAEYVFENLESEEISPSSRRFISYVPQGNTLMSGTIRKNLMIGDENATEEMMWQALEFAEAARFVRKCPDGLDTVLSEKAGGLSEGQAQRIAIARAVLRNRPVMILDEATSALDEDTEAGIFKKLKDLGDKTCFIITHRKSMLEYCDRVIKIDAQGRVTIKDCKNNI